jgi:hypothetical protein
MHKTPRISATGHMLLLSPMDDCIRCRVEFFSRAGNFQGYTVCQSKADAIRHRRKLYRLHERLAKERSKR